MRKLLFAAVAVAAFAFMTATPQQAKASWLGECLQQRLDPGYGYSCYSPGYDSYAPGYGYGPSYYSAPAYDYYSAPYYTPYRSYYAAPSYSYYGPSYYGPRYGDAHDWHEHHGGHEWHEHHHH